MKLFLTLLFFGSLALLLAYANATIQRHQRTGRYKAIKPLSEAEQVLYWRLVEALPEYVILCQVTFSRFMRTVGRMAFGEYMAMNNHISQKSIDFLVCLKDFTVVAAIELDDASHRSDKDAARDEILRNGGIEILRVHVRDIPSVPRLRELFTTDGLYV